MSDLPPAKGKSTRCWSLEENGRIDPYAFRTRRMVQLMAARGMMGAGAFRNICLANGIDSAATGDVTVTADIQRYWPCIRALWREVQRGHPTARLVRVEVKRV